MHPHATLLHTFYQAFQVRDHRAMAGCYHPQARFSDPVFRDLRGPRVASMWHMLCERGRDLELEYSSVQADDGSGRALWEARYTFSATGRPVHNQVESSFRFEDGRIVVHEDKFNLWRWSSQALGLKGRLLGWTPLVQGAIRKQAGKGLELFEVKHGPRSGPGSSR